MADIPATYLVLYRAAGEQYRLDWAVLAAIGKVETDHGRSALPGVRSGVNCAGAAGRMQFGIGAGDHGCGDAGNAWAVYGVDGDGDGDRDVYDPADAMPAAARYLRASGAPSDYRRAIFAPTTTPTGTSPRCSSGPSATAARSPPQLRASRRKCPSTAPGWRRSLGPAFAATPASCPTFASCSSGSTSA